VLRPSPNPAAQALAKRRWDNTPPEERKKVTAPAHAARSRAAAERRIQNAIAELLAAAPAWTDERRREVAALLLGSETK
jgi:hypothetical protein